MNLDLDAIERAAREATPGPWSADQGKHLEARPIAEVGGYEVCSPSSPFIRAEPIADARYIAAASPDAVLALVRIARAAVDWKFWLRHHEVAAHANSRHNLIEALRAAGLLPETP